MNAFRIATPAIIAAASLFAMSAHAADGTINFTGEVTSMTCTIDINGQPSGAPVSVVLPTVSYSQLSTQGDVAGRTAVNIQLSGCTGGSATLARAFFNNGATIDDGSIAGGLLGNLKNMAVAGATNVELQLLDGVTQNPIAAGQTSQMTDTSQITIASSGTTTLPYSVQYYATDAATAGAVTSQVTFNVDYQ